MNLGYKTTNSTNTNLHFNGKLIISDDDNKHIRHSLKKRHVNPDIINNIPVENLKGDIYIDSSYSLMKGRQVSIKYQENNLPDMKPRNPMDAYPKWNTPGHDEYQESLNKSKPNVISTLNDNVKNIPKKLGAFVDGIQSYSNKSKVIDKAIELSDNKLTVAGSYHSAKFLDSLSVTERFNHSTNKFVSTLPELAKIAKNFDGNMNVEYLPDKKEMQIGYYKSEKEIYHKNLAVDKHFDDKKSKLLKKLPDELAKNINHYSLQDEIMGNISSKHSSIHHNEILNNTSNKILNNIVLSLNKLNDLESKTPGMYLNSINNVNNTNVLCLRYVKGSDKNKPEGLIKQNYIPIDENLDQRFDKWVDDMPKYLNKWSKLETLVTDTNKNTNMFIDGKTLVPVVANKNSKFLDHITYTLEQIHKHAKKLPGELEVSFDGEKEKMVVNYADTKEDLKNPEKRLTKTFDYKNPLLDGNTYNMLFALEHLHSDPYDIAMYQQDIEHYWGKPSGDDYNYITIPNWGNNPMVDSDDAKLNSRSAFGNDLGVVLDSGSEKKNLSEDKETHYNNNDDSSNDFVNPILYGVITGSETI